DVVGGEKGFEMAADDFSVAQDGDGVVEGPADRGGIPLGVTDHGVDAGDVRGDLLEAAEVVFDEARLEEQVFWGIADDGEFGEDHHFRAAGFGLIDKIENLSAIPADVADGGIDLGQGDLHYWIL